MLASMKINNSDFMKIEENTRKILLKLFNIDKNLYTKFRNIFTKIYLEIIGDIKSKIFQIFYNQSYFTKNSEEEFIGKEIGIEDNLK
jgi:hypothetical protein